MPIFVGLPLAVGLHLTLGGLFRNESDYEEPEMDNNYVFLCGVMWCKFGQEDAGKELLRAANSADPDLSAMAWAMLANGARRLRELETAAQNYAHAFVR
jgi:hypothetical protein